ncbi:hypothetical protein G7Y79_00041g077990 [Physcia stellaris]|nr:hypothetical protein G7Y79_00041g077990 [Physcia stellaris]
MTVTDLMVDVGLISRMPSPRQLRRDYNRKIQELKKSAKETRNAFFRHLEWTSRRDRWIHEMEKQVVACLMQTRKERTGRLNRTTPTIEEAQAVVEINNSATLTQTTDEQPRSGASPHLLPNARPGIPQRSSNQYRRETRRYTPY